jgi:hypothetical protein
MAMATNKDVDVSGEWRINDEVTHLREWASGAVHPMPPTTGEHIIGAADGCWLKLTDPTGRISRQHAKLLRMQGRWAIKDMRSTNGIRLDGALRGAFAVSPGVEIAVGGITLVAESPRWLALRDVVGRLLGWSDERRGEVDLALRAVRLAATRRETLLLCGDGDLVAIARLLHRHALGDDRPFVLCDPRRRTAELKGQGASVVADAMAALTAAVGGTLCVWKNRQPLRFGKVVEATRAPDSRVQLIVCSRALLHGEPVITSPVILPPLMRRASELDRIIDAYAADALAEIGGMFPPADRAWVRANEAETLSQIEIATRRIIALRSAGGGIARAAQHLGLSHGTLSEWLARRALPDMST